MSAPVTARPSAEKPKALPGVIVTGATSQIGRFLLPRLLAAGYRVEAWSRGQVPGDSSASGLSWKQCDMSRDEPLNCTAAALIHLAPLWLLPARIDALAAQGVHRIIAFSSTSRFSKLDSAAVYEQWIAAQLSNAEALLEARSTKNGVAWTVFRPTLVYGCGLDSNVSAIARFIQRYGFFPLTGHATGLRQPVHADDLAGACVAALHYPLTHGRAYDLSGGETLGYQEMVERVFQGLGKPVRIPRIPLAVFSAAVRTAALLPAYRHFNPEMVERTRRDLCFSHAQATHDFGYHPRPFEFKKSCLDPPASPKTPA